MVRKGYLNCADSQSNQVPKQDFIIDKNYYKQYCNIR